MEEREFSLAIHIDNAKKLEKIDFHKLPENSILILDDLKNIGLQNLEAINNRIKLYTVVENPFIDLISYKYISNQADIDDNYDFYVVKEKNFNRKEISLFTAMSHKPVLVEADSLENIKGLKGCMMDGIIINYDNIESFEGLSDCVYGVLLDPSRYDLFIVDYDGTILDSMPMWKELYKDFLDNESIKTDKDVFSMVTKLTNVEIIKLLHDEFMSSLSIKEVENKFYSFLRKRYLECKCKPGAEKLLKKLKNYGRVVIYSATAKALLLDSIEKLSLNDYLDEVYSGSDLNISKGDGSGYLKIIELNSGYKSPLIVEDAMHAIDGAAMQGLDILAVYDKYNLNSFTEIISKANYFINTNR